MRFVHSLWTKPMLNEEREIKSFKQVITALFCHAQSVAYLKKLNQTIILYADDFAREILDFLPYDEIKPLEVDEDNPKCLWAQGKFYALKQMELQDIHIDGDVFIKSPLLVERIHYGINNYDLIVQSIEDDIHTVKHYNYCRNIADKYDIDFINGANNIHSAAYNCGLVGFNNQQLKYEYMENYFHCLEQLKHNQEAQEEIATNRQCWMDLLFEQKNLYDIAADYDVFNLLGKGIQAYKYALRLGYQHILGDTKWDRLNDIKQQLLNTSQDIYYATEDKLQELEEKML